LNPKLQKVIREIERTREKIAELQAALPVLEKQKTELENAEIIKAFRSADVAPGDFTAFIEAYKYKEGTDARLPERPAPQPNTMEEKYSNEEE